MTVEREYYVINDSSKKSPIDRLTDYWRKAVKILLSSLNGNAFPENIEIATIADAFSRLLNLHCHTYKSGIKILKPFKSIKLPIEEQGQ